VGALTEHFDMRPGKFLLILGSRSEIVNSVRLPAVFIGCGIHYWHSRGVALTYSFEFQCQIWETWRDIADAVLQPRGDRSYRKIGA